MDKFVTKCHRRYEIFILWMIHEIGILLLIDDEEFTKVNAYNMVFY